MKNIDKRRRISIKEEGKREWKERERERETYE